MLKQLNIIYYAKKQGLDQILIYRPTAKRIFSDVLSDFSTLSSDDILECSFQDVDMCDVSFVDEFIINLQKYVLQHQNTVMIITNTNECVQENLEAALTLRNKQDQSKICLLLYDNCKYRVFGDLEKNLKETYDLIKNSDEISARIIAQKFGIEINSASNRLKKLFDLRLLLRREVIDESGRQHKYYLPTKK